MKINVYKAFTKDILFHFESSITPNKEDYFTFNNHLFEVKERVFNMGILNTDNYIYVDLYVNDYGEFKDKHL